ncbi:MAG TPA: hypothetical protein VMD08_17920 [Candidatus Baltobacteraceae bacterium]|nr:hypothetical protein [Candidatus Baltobacteraceae bacterium]
MTAALAPLDAEIADLTETEAEALTSRIRQWANARPAEDIVRAYRGRIWRAMGCESWDDWCETELGGFRPQAALRREIVVELAGLGMSNVAIANVVHASEGTIRNDLATSQNYEVDPERKTIGKDGKERRRPKREPKPKPEPVVPSFEEAVLDAGNNALKAGAALLAAKASMGEEDWKPWLSANFHESAETASEYMQLAQNVKEAQEAEPDEEARRPYVADLVSGFGLKAIAQITPDDQLTNLAYCALFNVIEACGMPQTYDAFNRILKAVKAKAAEEGRKITTP